MADQCRVYMDRMADVPSSIIDTIRSDYNVALDDPQLEESAEFYEEQYIYITNKYATDRHFYVYAMCNDIYIGGVALFLDIKTQQVMT